MYRRDAFQHLRTRLAPSSRQRSKALRRFYTSIGLVHFGSIHQHDDDVDVIRGFTASLTHRDSHYAVGTYDGYALRMVSRSDSLHTTHNKRHIQQWTILEIALHRKELRHFVFVPTGSQAGEYDRLFETQPHLQPLNSMLSAHHSPEFHGRFQILSRPSHSQEIERLFTSPVIVGIASRFWPHGIEVEHGRLLIYLTERRLTKTLLETTLTSALWLAETIDATDDL